MNILIHKALWGMKLYPMEQNLELIREADFDGAEADIDAVDVERYCSKCRELALDPVVQVISGDADDLIVKMRRAADAGATHINTHGGKDHFTFEEGCAFFEKVLTVCESLSIPVTHETHRGRILYAPWTTAAYLEKFPELRITADFSHWCCVTESMLAHLDHFLEPAIQASSHVHTRVGMEEGPQVSDPRAPEHHRYLDAHMGWWKRIASAQRAKGVETLRFVPEFGPPHYQWTLPYTRQPIADIWEIAVWMRGELLRELSEG